MISLISRTGRHYLGQLSTLSAFARFFLIKIISSDVCIEVKKLLPGEGEVFDMLNTKIASTLYHNEAIYKLLA